MALDRRLSRAGSQQSYYDEININQNANSNHGHRNTYNFSNSYINTCNINAGSANGAIQQAANMNRMQLNQLMSDQQRQHSVVWVFLSGLFLNNF